jgi:hypothetical protein
MYILRSMDTGVIVVSVASVWQVSLAGVGVVRVVSEEPWVVVKVSALEWLPPLHMFFCLHLGQVASLGPGVRPVGGLVECMHYLFPPSFLLYWAPPRHQKKRGV